MSESNTENGQLLALQTIYLKFILFCFKAKSKVTVKIVVCSKFNNFQTTPTAPTALIFFF